MRKSVSGFTIVELLIVIVIIGILAAITIVAYGSIQNNARATAIADGIKKVEKAFLLKLTEDEASVWPYDADLVSGGNPTIGYLISTTNLKSYIQSAPNVSGMNLDWRYDNDVGTYGGCSVGADGVNILIYRVGTDTTIPMLVDKKLDDGNLTCGTIRFKADDNGGAIYYNMSRNSTFN